MTGSQEFTKQFLNHIQPDHRVLDLGAGEGSFSQMFAERGAQVTAVEKESLVLEDPLVTFVNSTIEDFICDNETGVFDLVFMRNIIQFLDKYWVFEMLFPWLEKHVARKGVVGIETFYEDPKPPFDPAMRSLYTTQELSEYFFSWHELLAKTYEHKGFDMNGVPREFFVSDLIVQKS